MKKKFFSTKHDESIKSGLKKIIPRAEKILIHFSKGPKGVINSHITLKTKGLNLTSKKVDLNLVKGLHKAQSAIIKQFKKKRFKKNWKRVELFEN